MMVAWIKIVAVNTVQKQMESRHILETEPTGLAAGWKVGCK